MTGLNEAAERKRRSEENLRRQGVPLNEQLPLIEPDEEVDLRSQQEVADRAIGLSFAAAIADLRNQGRPAEQIEKMIAGNGRVIPFLSPKEKAFIDLKQPSEKDIYQFLWRYEAYWTLLWSLGFVDSLGKPEKPCDVNGAMKMLLSRGLAKFSAESKLRTKSEILDEADMAYRYHWAVRNAQLGQFDAVTGQFGPRAAAIPGDLDPDVVMERHYALNWLIKYENQEWDDVTTDT